MLLLAYNIYCGTKEQQTIHVLQHTKFVQIIHNDIQIGMKIAVFYEYTFYYNTFITHTHCTGVHAL